MGEYAASDAGMKTLPGEGATTSMPSKSAASFKKPMTPIRCVGSENDLFQWHNCARFPREEVYTLGSFEVKLMPPRDEADTFKNPIGVYITNFTWSREFSGAVMRDDSLRVCAQSIRLPFQTILTTEAYAMIYRRPILSFWITPRRGSRLAKLRNVRNADGASDAGPRYGCDRRRRCPMTLRECPKKSSRSKCRLRVPATSSIGVGNTATGRPNWQLAAVAAANASATTQPTTDGFLNAIQYYDYAPGVVYTAITSPGYVTTIALRPNEKLITAAAGDTVRWLVDSVQSGSGDSAQTLLLVKAARRRDCKRICSSPPTSESTRWILTSVDTGVGTTP